MLFLFIGITQDKRPRKGISDQSNAGVETKSARIKRPRSRDASDDGGGPPQSNQVVCVAAFKKTGVACKFIISYLQNTVLHYSSMT